MPFVVVNELSPAEKQTTSKSGSVTFQKSGSKFMVNPSARTPPTIDAYVKLTWSGATVHYPGEYREFSVTRKNGVIQIPLRRRWVEAEEPPADKASASGRQENRWKFDSGDVVPHNDPPGLVNTRPGN